MRNAVLIAKKCRLGSDSETALFTIYNSVLVASACATIRHMSLIMGGYPLLLKQGLQMIKSG